MQSSSLVPIPSLDQDLTATHLDIDSRAFASRVFGSSSLEEFDALIGHNDDSLFELIRGLSVEVSRQEPKRE